jgi:HAD superfamily hydrolase (TIGR01549 family)
MKPDLILIDIDNTIACVGDENKQAMSLVMNEFFQVDYKHVEKYLTLMQRSRPQDLTAEHPILHLSIAAKQSNVDVDVELVHDAYESYIEEIERRVREVPGARSFLLKGYGEGVPLVALTNNFMSIAIKRLVKLKLAKYISEIVTPEVYGFGKPSAFLFQTILRDLGVKSSNVVMIGDNPVTDGGCRQVGIRYCPIDLSRSEEQYSELESEFFD